METPTQPNLRLKAVTSLQSRLMFGLGSRHAAPRESGEPVHSGRGEPDAANTLTRCLPTCQLRAENQCLRSFCEAGNFAHVAGSHPTSMGKPGLEPRPFGASALPAGRSECSDGKSRSFQASTDRPSSSRSHPLTFSSLGSLDCIGAAKPKVPHAHTP